MVLTALYLCIFLAVFNFTSAIMGGSYIVGELGGSSDISSYNVTFFGLGNASSFILASSLSKRFGSIKTLITFLCFLLVTLLTSGSSPTFFIFVLVHFLSGFASGVFFPLSLEILSHKLTAEGQKVSFAFLALLTSLTPVIGACLGGWMAYDYNWRWVFYLQIPLIIFCIITLSKEKDPPLTPQEPFDKIGYFFYLLTIGSFVTAICLGQQLDWFRSPLINTLLAFSAVSFGFFCIWEWRQKNPFLNLHFFKIPAFTLSLFLMGTLFAAYFGMIILLSLWLRLDANYTPIWISVLLLTMVFAGGILFLFMIKWSSKMPPYIPILFSILAFALSCFYSATFNVDVDFFRLAIARILAGFGLAFFFFPLLSICLNSIPKEKQSEASSIFQTCRLLCASLGVSLYTTIWYRRQIFYHDRLGSTLTLDQETTKKFFLEAKTYGIEGSSANELLEQALQKQATALALADCFYFMGWVMISILGILSIYLLITRKNKINAFIQHGN